MKTYPLTKYYNITLFYVTFVLTIQKNSRFEPGTPVQLRPWIDCIFYLPSIEKFETLTIQKYKKYFLPTGLSNSNFDDSSPWKSNFDTWGPRKSNLGWGPWKSNEAGGRGPRAGAGSYAPRKSNTPKRVYF